MRAAGLKRATEVTSAHLQTWQVQLLKTVSPRTARHYVFAASGMMAYAVRQGYVRSNPARDVPKVKALRNPPRFLSIEEWGEVKNAAQECYLWPLVATAYYTRMRNAELRFLCWEEFDFGRAVITIRNKPELVFTLKNREARTIPLNKELKRILEPLRKEKGLCFLNSRGKQFDGGELDREFARPAAVARQQSGSVFEYLSRPLGTHFNDQPPPSLLAAYRNCP